MLIDDGRTSRMAGADWTGTGVAVGAVGGGVGLGVGFGFGVGVGLGVGIGVGVTTTARVGVVAGADLAAVAEPQEASSTLTMARKRTTRIAFFRVLAWIRCESADNERKAWYSIGTFLRKSFSIGYYIYMAARQRKGFYG